MLRLTPTWAACSKGCETPPPPLQSFCLPPDTGILFSSPETFLFDLAALTRPGQVCAAPWLLSQLNAVPLVSEVLGGP